MNQQYDLNDPNLDFDLQEKLHMADLLRARKMQDEKAETLAQIGGRSVPWNPGTSIGNIANNLAGKMDQGRAVEQLSGLSGEQRQRFDALSQELNRPGTVNYDDPADLQRENSRRAGLAMQMQRLPMARKMAEGIATQTEKFPETMMLRRQGQLETARQLEDKQAAQADRDATNNVLKMTLAKMASDDKRYVADTRPNSGGSGNKYADKEQAKLRAKMPKEFSDVNEFTTRAASLIGDVQGILDDRENLENASGYIKGRSWMPTFRSGSMLAEKNISNVKSNLLLEGKRLLSESGKPGSISQQEWPIFQDMVAQLDTATDPKVLVDQLTRVQDYMRTKVREKREGYMNAYEDTPDGQDFRDLDEEAIAYKKRRFEQTKAEGGISSPAPKGKGRAFPKSTGQGDIIEPAPLEPTNVNRRQFSGPDGKYTKNGRTFTVTNGVPEWDK